MSFPRYPKYKDSGVKSLGHVPEHWTVKQLGYLCSRIGSGKTPLGGAEIYCDEGVVFIRSQNVYDEGLFLHDVVYISAEVDEELRASRVQAGDILLNITGASLGRTCLVPDGLPRANVNQHVCVIRLNDFAMREFVAHSMKSCSTKGQIETAQTGAARDGLNFSQIAKLTLTVPPLLEQIRIAAFLDRETAKIDELVAEQWRLIELLKEKRHAVISHAVTKGLSSHAPMKPSGIEWLGDVPAHWRIKRLKHISPFMTVGIVVNPSKFVSDEGLPFIYGGDIREGVIDWANARRIDAASSEANSKTRLKAGDLLTVRVGAPGVTAVVPVECENGNCASVMLIRQGSYNSHWLCYAMNTRIVRFQVEVVQYGAAQEQFNISHAVNFWVPVPPRAEQDELVEFLDGETAKLTTLAAEAQRAINLLRERRTALISAAVTGQIDVRQLAERKAVA